MNMQETRDMLAREMYGETAAQARARGVCISCQEPPRFYSSAGAAEYLLSALCEYCFDDITKEEE